MIFKSDLVEAINGLSHDFVALSIRVSDLEKKVNEKNTVQVKRSTGNRKTSVWTEESKKIAKELAGQKVMSDLLGDMIKDAKKNKTKVLKSTNAKKQPRTKDGKFAKKK